MDDGGERKKKILATEMDAIERSAGISKLKHKFNNYIKQQIAVKKTVIEEIEEKQLKWYEHVQRMDERMLPKQLLELRKRGRSKKNCGQGTRKFMSKRQLNEGEWNDRRQ
ncbi:hypothetical protein ILUMI_11627 [Ignelater luminosus]|uniref:Uncharacterized protein n=1 Tax=Ignelater luminosus TaxID=2038154 RepID=A0A8K0CVM9_IGNLU|nr:hypothetical protein ILUMI_11627 [Ignelater luminosus]